MFIKFIWNLQNAMKHKFSRYLETWTNMPAHSKRLYEMLQQQQVRNNNPGQNSTGKSQLTSQ